MKVVLVSALVAAGVLMAGAVQASPELATSAGCMKCHDIDKKKKAEPFKAIATKYKGKAGAEATIFKSITDAKGDHPEMAAKPEEIKTVIKWVLTL
ncbi:MAG: cytochrome C' [Rubrivivax sp.]|nr:cytochrome C' [Rubrivivax sp.]